MCCLSAFFRIISDCERFTWPISAHPASKEAGELGLPSGTYFIARRLQWAAVAMLLWFWWPRDVRFGCNSCFVFERTRSTASTRHACLIYHSTSNEAGVFLRTKRLFMAGCAQASFFRLACLSVCWSVGPFVFLSVCLLCAAGVRALSVRVLSVCVCCMYARTVRGRFPQIQRLKAAITILRGRLEHSW